MEEKLKQALKEAVHTFYQKDQKLIEIKGTERACVFRIGIYLQEIIKRDDDLKGLSVDSEYNKKRTAPKKLAKALVRPDLIIHERLSDSSNMLAIEFKGWWNKGGHDKDIEKLKNLTDSHYGYSYRLAIFVQLGEDENLTKYRYFEGGEEVTIPITNS